MKNVTSDIKIWHFLIFNNFTPLSNSCSARGRCDMRFDDAIYGHLFADADADQALMAAAARRLFS